MLEELSNSLDYIEENLQEDITIEEIAKYTSKLHYQRMFFMLTGSTVFEYFRRCRLTLAAQELAAFKANVFDVALKYGYDSPESFSKASWLQPFPSEKRRRSAAGVCPANVGQNFFRMVSVYVVRTCRSTGIRSISCERGHSCL
ncbi:helix-turn-helix domain-containing protein [Bacillus atrophaeus]|uniref:Transcriptional regulatory protein n=2 Tax=Bacillus atrophaeus TaxID=1452 RepID=A0ABN3ZB69_BACA1|nr:putative transcriptional regulatory protein [Bacillus atrophaeus 1942]AIK48933.1 helix-turn-helix domain protein [Bacillus atrophaeus subsp. globigii]KFK82788.1 helix-turn-helix domain protein [Bacillus atrophaeus]